MHLKSFIYIFILLLLVGSLSSCSSEDGLAVESQTTKVVINGLQSEAESLGAGLKTVFVNRIKDESNESLNTPDNIAGYTINVYRSSDLDIPYLSETFEFVDKNGDENGVVSDVIIGKNTFVAESIGRRKDGRKWVEFTDGWTGITGEMKKEKGDIEKRMQKYNDKMLKDYPLFTLYRDTVENVYVNATPAENNISFDMMPVNGRLAVIIENERKDTKLDIYIHDMMIKSGLGKDRVFYYLLNDRTEGKVELNIKIEYLVKIDKKAKKVSSIDKKLAPKKNDYEVDPNLTKKISETLVPGMNKTKLFNVK